MQRMIFLLLGAGLCACATPQVAPATALEREARLAALVSPERAASRVRALCALGPRMGGTASGDAAAGFVALALADHGLDVRIETDPPGMGVVFKKLSKYSAKLIERLLAKS